VKSIAQRKRSAWNPVAKGLQGLEGRRPQLARFVLGEAGSLDVTSGISRRVAFEQAGVARELDERR